MEHSSYLPIPTSKDLNEVTRLEDLFTIEIFPKNKNTFIDQKFLDYLAVNGHEIENIHWRNFEKLIAEFFNKQGFKVVLGPGSNDGGVDIRVFNEMNQVCRLFLSNARSILGIEKSQ